MPVQTKLPHLLLPEGVGREERREEKRKKKEILRGWVRGRRKRVISRYLEEEKKKIDKKQKTRLSLIPPRAKIYKYAKRVFRIFTSFSFFLRFSFKTQNVTLCARALPCCFPARQDLSFLLPLIFPRVLGRENTKRGPLFCFIFHTSSLLNFYPIPFQSLPLSS